MRTLIYSVNFAPDLTGIGKYSGDMAAWLVEQGHEVRVVAAPPYYPNWKLQPGYTAPTYRRESWRGISVWRAPIWVPRSPTGLKRILHLASFALTSWPVMLRQVLWRPDIVLTVAPAFVCAPTGWLTARLCGARAWLHLQDFEVDVAFELGLVKGEPVRRAVLQMERWLLRRFDAVSSISNRMIERLTDKGVRKERTLFFPNWVDISRIAASSGDTGYRAQLSIPPDALVVLFSGTLGGKQGLSIIPDVAKILADRKDIVFVICGDGVMKAQLQAETASLTNVRHLPLQPLERLGDLLSTADIQVLPQCPGAADLVMPSKLSGMLASGRPVIATCDRGTEIEAVVSRCGVVVPPEDRAALAAAICQLADEPATRRALGARARDYATENFDRDAVLRRVFAVPAQNEEMVTVDLVPTTDGERMQSAQAAGN
jgi:colanic acid biosynthesis glycosyl transferase WcaI